MSGDSLPLEALLLHSSHLPKTSKESISCDMETSRKSIDSAREQCETLDLFPELDSGSAALLTKPLDKQTVGNMQEDSFED